MRRNFASTHGFNAFLRRLAVALPVNLAVAWFMFNGQQTATLVIGSTAAAGSLLAMALEPRSPQDSGKRAIAEPSAVADTMERVSSKQRSPGFGGSVPSRNA